MASERAYTGAGGSGRWVVTSLAALALLATGLAFLAREPKGAGTGTIRVYCAAGLRPPVEEAARLYEEELGVRVELQYDNSGGLLGSIEIHPEGDLYIPAEDLFIARGRAKGLIAESIPLAKLRLVVAVKPGNPRGIRSLDDLLVPSIGYAICSDSAAAGQTARIHLEKVGRWDEVLGGAKTRIPTVTNAAASLESSSSLDAAFIWDSTAKQHGLEIVEIPELASAVASIEAGVITATRAPDAALRFARYLAAPEKGGPIFAKHRYEPVPGDAWAETPELRVFCGGVNRNAVKATIDEFAAREGCRIEQIYGGCGMLIGQIETSPLEPEIFLTCDASYLDMVKDLFLDPGDVSETRIVMLVREGSAIRTPADLAAPGVKLGITEPKASALGALSVALLDELGLWARVRDQVRVHSPTAHELVLKMEASDALDVALVYEANCQGLKGGFEIIPIDHPRAKATQNIAVGRRTRFPQLAERLKRAIVSERSASRFTASGFRWIAGENPGGP